MIIVIAVYTAKNKQPVQAWWKQHWTMFCCPHCSRLSTIPDCRLFQAQQLVQYCWQHCTMLAAKHCSMLFSSGQDRLFIFGCVLKIDFQCHLSEKWEEPQQHKDNFLKVAPYSCKADLYRSVWSFADRQMFWNERHMKSCVLRFFYGEITKCSVHDEKFVKPKQYVCF